MKISIGHSENCLQQYKKMRQASCMFMPDQITKHKIGLNINSNQMSFFLNDYVIKFNLKPCEELTNYTQTFQLLFSQIEFIQ